MKKLSLVASQILVLALGLTSLFISGTSFADYNTDALSGDVICKGSGVSVTLSADRNQISVASDGVTTVYNITGRSSDGDSEVTYSAKMAFSLFNNQVQLILDDRGDQLNLNGAVTSLTCPQ